MDTPTQRRVHSVDLLRGALAASVYVYHLLYVHHVAEIEIIAYYAVYGFFVISGFSLYVTYARRLDVRTYLVRRFFRIAPLFYVVLLATPIVKHWPPHWPYTLPFNLTLTFGLWDPGANSLVGGGWSIGIEVIFYLFFPVILAFPLTAFALFLPLAVIFNNVTLAHNLSMLEPGIWGKYTQPISTLVYFAAGAAIGKLYLRFPTARGGWLIAIPALLTFVFIQTETSLQLLTRATGIVLMLSTILIVGGVVFGPAPNKAIAHWAGELSYPVYLIHPLTFYLSITQSVLVTLIASFFVNVYIERPLRALGRKL